MGPKLVETAQKRAVENFNAFYSKTVMTKQKATHDRNGTKEQVTQNRNGTKEQGTQNRNGTKEQATQDRNGTKE